MEMEKTLFAQTAEIRGKASPGIFTASFQMAPSEERLKQTRGTLFFLIQVEAASEDKGRFLCRELFENFKVKFYQSSSSILKALEEAIEELKESLREREIKGNLIAATLWGSVFYVAKVGSTGLILARGGSAKEIDFAKVASGALSDKDTVFLADEGFIGTVNLETLDKTCQGSDFAGEIKNLQTEYHKKEGTAFAVHLSVQEPIEQPQAVLIADLDKQEGVGGNLARDLRRKIPLRLPAWRTQFDFFENIQSGFKLIAAKLAPYVKEYARKAAFVILSPWLPRPPGVLEDDASRKRKRITQVIILLAIVLVLSVGVGSISRARNEASKKKADTITSVESKLSEAEKIKTSDPAKATSLLASAEEELGSLSDKDSKLASLREKLTTLYAEINRIFSVSLDSFVDLSSQKGGIQAKALKSASGFLFVLDQATGSVYRINLKSKEVLILVSEKKELQTIAATKDFLYFQTKTEIRRVDIQTKAEKKVASASSKWQSVLKADTYGDNLYLLDRGAKQVWKYTLAADALVGPYNYFVGTPPQDPVSFAVDGSVWIVTKTELSKFFGGKSQKFEVKNSPRAFSEIVDIYSREGFANLYILDKGVGGVFVIEKTSGNYSALYTDDKLKEATSIAVDEASRTVWVLIGNTVHSFNLK